MSEDWSNYVEACQSSLFPDFSDEDSEMCFLLLSRDQKPNFDLEKLPKIYASSYASLWTSYWKKVGGDKPKIPKNHQKAFRDLVNDPETKVVPILLTAELFFAAQIWGSVGSTRPAKPSQDTKPSKGNLPKVQLVHIPSRKAWPFALMGDTKKIKDFLKFPDAEEKISAFVTNVNKELGPGWNLKEEAKALLEDQDQKSVEIEFMTLEEYKNK